MKPNTKKRIKGIIRKMHDSRLSPVWKFLYDRFTMLHYHFLCAKWRLQGHKKPSAKEAAAVAEEVTFICKSFERQYMPKRFYRSIQKYFPGARVIIADDSSKPLKLKGKYLTVVQLPFNQGISRGLNAALELVETPFTMRLDEDVLLTPFAGIHTQLRFLHRHGEVDLSSVMASNSPVMPPPQKVAKQFVPYSMSNAPKPLIIPHKTKLDDTHYVMGKVSNLFLIRTEKYKALGYDNAIRMIDHHEFFMRAAGNIVSVMDISAFVFHYHNRFDRNYDRYRFDIRGDREYIKLKYGL